MNTRIVLALASAALSCTGPAMAGTSMPSLATTTPVTPAGSDWHWGFNLNGWGTAFKGDVMILGQVAEVDAGIDDVLENLDSVIMAAVEVGRGRWSFLADFNYAGISSSNSGRVAYTRASMSEFVGNFVLTYRMIETPRTRFDVYAGVRVTSLEAELEVYTPRNTLLVSGDRNWVDPIVGVRFQQELSDRLFLRAAGDVGGFGVASDFTWQALAALGYRLGDTGSVLLGYRGIGIDYRDGGFAYDVIAHGPLLGLEFRF